MDIKINATLTPYQRVTLHNFRVQQILSAGGSLEDVIVALDKAIDEKNDEIIQLHLIAPRRYREADGTLWVYHVPDHLIPITELEARIPR